MLKLFGAALVLAGLGLVATAGQALAHAEFVTSTPAPDSRVAVPPSQISIVFTSAVARNGTAITVVSPAGATVSGATAVQGNTATAAIQASASGVYQVRWSNVSLDDGHEKSGEFRFTVVAAPQPSTAAAPPPSPAGPQAMPRAGASAEVEGRSTFWLLALAGTVLTVPPAIAARRRMG
jgi:copper transport protein